MDDTEALRQKILATFEEPEEAVRERYAPGTFGCHEALHMASYLMMAVDSELLSHGAVVTNPEWFTLANQAFDSLFALYQAIGATHGETPRQDGEAPAG